MPKPGELWTWAQALVWISCTLGDILSDGKRDRIIDKCRAKVGDSEWMPFHALSFVIDRKLDEDIDESDRIKRVSEAWRMATDQLADEVQRGQISVSGCEADGPPLPLSRMDRAALILREVDDEVKARRPNDHVWHWRWRWIRFDAAEIVERWPFPSTTEAESSVSCARDNPTNSGRRGASQIPDVARALRELYPSGAPAPNRGSMRKAVEAKIGRGVSSSTLDRARKVAWLNE